MGQDWQRTMAGTGGNQTCWSIVITLVHSAGIRLSFSFRIHIEKEMVYFILIRTTESFCSSTFNNKKKKICKQCSVRALQDMEMEMLLSLKKI